MEKMPKKVLAVGGIRTVSERFERPVLYYIPPSFNSAKARLAMALSQVADDCELKWTLHMRDNYTPEYARINPDTMAVPSMQIDNKVITDSFDMCKYLSQTYPGEGDKHVASKGKTADMWAFIDFVKQWDEYVFTYGTVMSQSSADFVNGLRLAMLRYYLNQVMDDEPDDKEFLVEKYIQKIAGVTCMLRVQEDGESKTKDLAENKVYLWKCLDYGNRLLEQHGDGWNGFLFGEDPCTADCFFLPIFRIFAMMVKEMAAEVAEKYPRLNSYWEMAQDTEVVHEALMSENTRCKTAQMMMSLGVPKTMLAYKTGLFQAPELPDEIEKRISEATEAKWKDLRNT